MSQNVWAWAAAKATGTSHTKAGVGCDDFGSCLEIPGSEQSILVGVVSDGAGSAKYSAIGSQICCRVFAKRSREFIKQHGDVRNLSVDTVHDWIDEIRDRIACVASNRQATKRDFACTLVGALIGPDFSVFIHVGDGAAVYRTRNEPDWIVPSWPAQGEYASTTYFVTDDPEAATRIVCVDDIIEEVAIFTDGIEQLVLEFAERQPHAPFFNSMFKPLSRIGSGRSRTLSRSLEKFLGSEAVCEKTDDDKTLILAMKSISS